MSDAQAPDDARSVPLSRAPGALAPERQGRTLVALAALGALRPLAVLGSFGAIAATASRHHLDGAALALSLGALPLAQALLAVPVAQLSDRLGRRRASALGLGALALGMLLSAASSSAPSLISGQLCAGLGALSLVELAWALDVLGAAGRIRSQATRVALGGVVFALAGPGFAALSASTASLAWSFLPLGILCALGAALVLLFGAEPLRGPCPAPPAAQRAPLAFADPMLRRLGLAAAFAAAAVGGLAANAALLDPEELLPSVAWFAALPAWIVLMAVSARLLDRQKAALAAALGVSLPLLGAALALLVAPGAVGIAGLSALGLLVASLSSTLIAKAPEELRAPGLHLVESLLCAGLALGAALAIASRPMPLLNHALLLALGLAAPLLAVDGVRRAPRNIEG